MGRAARWWPWGFVCNFNLDFLAPEAFFDTSALSRYACEVMPFRNSNHDSTFSSVKLLKSGRKRPFKVTSFAFYWSFREKKKIKILKNFNFFKIKVFHPDLLLGDFRSFFDALKELCDIFSADISSIDLLAPNCASFPLQQAYFMAKQVCAVFWAVEVPVMTGFGMCMKAEICSIVFGGWFCTNRCCYAHM